MSSFKWLIIMMLALAPLSVRAQDASTDQSDEETEETDQFKRSATTRGETEAKSDRPKLRLNSGEDRVIDINFDLASAGGITIGNPTVVAVQLVKAGDKRQLVFKPLKAGESTVSVRDPEGNLKTVFQVTVTGTNLLRRAAEIRDLVRDIEGVEIKILGQKIVVDGEILVPSDYARLLRVIQDKAYADLVLNLTTISGVALNLLSKRIEQDIKAFAPEVSSRVVNGVIFLEGTTDNIDKARRAEEVAKLYLPEARPGNPLAATDPTAQVLQGRALIKNFILVSAPPPKKQEQLVRVTIHFVRLAKDYGKLFGFKWQPGLATSGASIGLGQQADGGTGASGPSLTATLNNLLPKLASAQNAGYARVLRTGNVIVRSGQQAELSDQVGVPYNTFDANGRTLAAVQSVGMAFGVTPQILGQSNDIALEVNLDQSTLSAKPTAGQAPSTLRHTLKTRIYVKSNETAALGGVSASDVSTYFNKDDPRQTTVNSEGGDATSDALFSLQRSKSYNKGKSEYVVFVTPQIITDASEGTDDLKKNFRVKVK